MVAVVLRRISSSLLILIACSSVAARTSFAADLENTSSSPVIFTRASVTPEVSDSNSETYTASSTLKGWDYVYNLLVRHGADPDQLMSVIQDPRMPQEETLYFGLNPKEPRRLYARLQTSKARKAAVACYRRYQSYFDEAAKRFEVSPGVVAGIVQTETACGKNFGRSMAFYRLARFVSAGDPATIDANFQQKSAGDKSITREQVEKRAKWLEQTFLPHTLATLVLASQKSVPTLDIVGSEAGAVGMPQFLPANLLNYGVDADTNGEIDLFAPHDAILSTANFLKVHGWSSPKMPVRDQRAVIWHYNRSAPYVDTVLGMSRAIEQAAVASAPRKSSVIIKRLKPLAANSPKVRP